MIDPHGDLIRQVRDLIPEDRQADLIDFNVPDAMHPLAFNPFDVAHPSLRPLVVSGLISTMRKIWPESWGPRMEYILRNVFSALLEFPRSTLRDVPRLLDDPIFRRQALSSAQCVSNGSQ